MIAHGAYVTTDVGISCFMFASIYALYRYIKAPSISRLIVLGLATGFALASKHSGVLLLPFGLAHIITEILWPSTETRTSKGKVALRLTEAFLAASVIAIVVLWTFYGFRYAARPGVKRQQQEGLYSLERGPESDLESVCYCLGHEYQFAINVGVLKPVFLETIRRQAEAEGKYIRQTELSQLSANHGDRPGWEGVHAVARGCHRDVLILSRVVGILHKSHRSDERMADVPGIVEDDMNRVGRIQIVVNQHQRPVPVGPFDSIRGNHVPPGSVHKVC